MDGARSGHLASAQRAALPCPVPQPGAATSDPPPPENSANGALCRSARRVKSLGAQHTQCSLLAAWSLGWPQRVSPGGTPLSLCPVPPVPSRRMDRRAATPAARSLCPILPRAVRCFQGRAGEGETPCCFERKWRDEWRGPASCSSCARCLCRLSSDFHSPALSPTRLAVSSIMWTYVWLAILTFLVLLTLRSFRRLVLWLLGWTLGHAYLLYRRWTANTEHRRQKRSYYEQNADWRAHKAALAQGRGHATHDTTNSTPGATATPGGFSFPAATAGSPAAVSTPRGSPVTPSSTSTSTDRARAMSHAASPAGTSAGEAATRTRTTSGWGGH
jgi:hypothetical protein